MGIEDGDADVEEREQSKYTFEVQKSGELLLLLHFFEEVSERAGKHEHWMK